LWTRTTVARRQMRTTSRTESNRLPPIIHSACENRINCFFWDFSAYASILQDAHLSLFIVVTRSLVPLIHFWEDWYYLFVLILVSYIIQIWL